MPGQAPVHADEHDLLLGYVAQQREVMRLTAYGLTDEQARAQAAAPPSPLSVGGLIKHVRSWSELDQPRILERGAARRPPRTTTPTTSRCGPTRPSPTCSRPRRGRRGDRARWCAPSPISVSRCRCRRACRGTRRPRRLVGTVGADAPRRRDRPPRRPRRHRPRGGRRRDRRSRSWPRPRAGRRRRGCSRGRPSERDRHEHRGRARRAARAEIGEFPTDAYLLTVRDDGRAHSVAVRCDGTATTSSSRRATPLRPTRTRGPLVALLWPPPERGELQPDRRRHGRRDCRVDGGHEVILRADARGAASSRAVGEGSDCAPVL